MPVGVPLPQPANVAMTYRGYWVEQGGGAGTAYNPGDVVWVPNPIENVTPGQLYICVQAITAGNVIRPGLINVAYWQQLSGWFEQVTSLNGSSSSVSLVSTDGSLVISGSGQTIDLSVPSVYTSLVWEGQVSPATGTTTLNSLDGTVVFAGEGGANSQLFLSARQLNLQRVLDAGITADDPTAPVLAPTTQISVFNATNNTIGGFAGNWLPVSPPEPLVQNAYIFPGATYQLCGLLNVVVSECGEGMFANLCLRINGQPNTLAQGLAIAGSPSIYQILDAPAPVAGVSPEIGSFYVPVNVVFTGPSSVPVSGVNLGLNAFCQSATVGSVLSMSCQWVDSFCLTELYASNTVVPTAPAPAPMMMARSAPAPALKKALPKKK